tara:strand:+ start:257 stop:472 length:216 start_codon:yes stop_codon:yes gene_type:complete
MEKVTLPMLSMIFKEVKERIEYLEIRKKDEEDNRLLGEKDILRAKVMQAEKELITSTLLFFHYLEESKIRF